MSNEPEVDYAEQASRLAMALENIYRQQHGPVVARYMVECIALGKDYSDVLTGNEEREEGLLRRSDFFKLVDDNIKEWGWHATGVFDNDPPFIYTAGLDAELLIVGLAPDQGHSILVSLLQGDHELVEGAKLDGVLVDFPVRLDPVDDAVRDEYMTVSAAWRDGKDFKALQVMWPDAKGLLPGEEGVDPEYASSQILTPTQDGGAK